MLVWAWIDSIYFILLCIGLCFGFVMEADFITLKCFCYFWAVLTKSQDLFCLSSSPSEAGHAQQGQTIPVIFHTIQHHAYEFLAVFCLCEQILLYLLNYLNLYVFSLFLSQFSSPSRQWEWRSGWIRVDGWD